MLGVLLLVAVVCVVVWRLRWIVLPLFAAALLMIVLGPVDRWLERRGLTSGTAAIVTLLGFVAAVAGIGLLVVPALIDQLPPLTDRLDDALGRLERWVQRERPFGFTGADVRNAVDDARDMDQPSTEALITGARAVGTAMAGLLFAIVATFFFLRDGPMMRDWAVGRLPADRRGDGLAVWRAIGDSLTGYVRGAAFLGAAEGLAIGITIALVGGDLPVLIGMLTFVAAFIPFAGAIAAGVMAVAVTLVSAGTTEAIIVAAVAFTVQQLDNDLLAPVVYGRFLRIHPLAVLASISVGIEVAGLVGAFAGVPVAASIISTVRVLAARDRSPSPLIPPGVHTGADAPQGHGPEDDDERAHTRQGGAGRPAATDP